MTIHRNLKGNPLCPVHWQELEYQGEFAVDGVTLGVWTCPLGEHVEYIPADDDDLSAAELIAA